jgi:K+-sensing histidine kinase KdpD
MSEMLADKDIPPEKRDEFMRGLKTGISRMEWLVFALLKFARLESGASELNASLVSAHGLVESALRPLEILLDVKDQRIDSSGVGDTALYCDAEWSAEALGNILKNAGEHSPKCSVILVASGETPLASWISVTDAGRGIDSEDMPDIFRRFHRSAKSDPESMGIGLSMALAIMRRQNGDIEVRNERGGGAVFTLKFYKTIV